MRSQKRMLDETLLSSISSPHSNRPAEIIAPKPCFSLLALAAKEKLATLHN
jgi:hypothetical protein